MKTAKWVSALPEATTPNHNHPDAIYSSTESILCQSGIDETNLTIESIEAAIRTLRTQARGKSREEQNVLTGQINELLGKKNELLRTGHVQPESKSEPTSTPASDIGATLSEADGIVSESLSTTSNPLLDNILTLEADNPELSLRLTPTGDCSTFKAPIVKSWQERAATASTWTERASNGQLTQSNPAHSELRNQLSPAILSGGQLINPQTARKPTHKSVTFVYIL
jgi:hypothetical protein